MNDFSEKSSAWKGPFDKASVRLATSTRQTDLLLPGTPSPIELEIPISQLPLAGRLFGDEMVAIVQNGITCRSSTAIIGAAGETPVLINKTMTLVYPATVGQTVFSLGSPDHYGRGFALNDTTALQVTIGGIRMIEDDGSGTWGQYVVDIGASTVTLITPFGTDPVVIVGDGDVAIFDIFNMNYPANPIGAARIHTQSLTPTAVNVFPPLLFKPNGDMTILYVNGRAYSDDTVPPSFAVSGQTIMWLDASYSVYPTDKVVISYAYSVFATAGGAVLADAFSIDTRALTIATANVFPPLLFKPNGLMTTVYINGVAFSDDSHPPSFWVNDHTIMWLNTVFSAVPGDDVVVAYTYDTGSDVVPVPLPGPAGFTTEALTVTGVNALAPLTHHADGGSFILTIDGYSFVAVGASPAFTYAGHTIIWHSTTYTIGLGANVAATYSYVSGT